MKNEFQQQFNSRKFDSVYRQEILMQIRWMSKNIHNCRKFKDSY